jgi:hypothetical protein
MFGCCSHPMILLFDSKQLMLLLPLLPSEASPA